MPSSPAQIAIGDTEVARGLYAGRYADILSQTIDSSAAGCRAGDEAFVVGALCFVGRVEEAELFLENARRAAVLRRLGQGPLAARHRAQQVVLHAVAGSSVMAWLAAASTSFGHSSARAVPANSSASTVNDSVPISALVRGLALRL